MIFSLAYRCSLVLCAALLYSNALGQVSQLPTLLTPVELSSDVLDRNWFSLERHKYKALQHRFVTIDVSLLNGDPPFTVSPFPGLEFTVIRKAAIRLKPDYTKWQGEIVSPIDKERLDSLTETDLTGYSVSEQRAVAAKRRKLVGVEFSIREKQAQRPADAPTNDSSSLGEDRIVRREMETITTVSSTITSSVHGRSFRLVPLEEDLGIHVIYEIDPSKVIPPDAPGGKDASQRYYDFIDSLRTEQARRNKERAD